MTTQWGGAKLLKLGGGESFCHQHIEGDHDCALLKAVFGDHGR
jgi:hypothetical protein